MAFQMGRSMHRKKVGSLPNQWKENVVLIDGECHKKSGRFNEIPDRPIGEYSRISRIEVYRNDCSKKLPPMIFSVFQKPKCAICRQKFQKYETVKSSDQEEMNNALSLSEFGCSRCRIKFHGSCGKIGQANPKVATITCPKCNTRIQHPLPFTVQIVKQTGAEQQIGERIEDDLPDDPE